MFYTSIHNSPHVSIPVRLTAAKITDFDFNAVKKVLN